MKYVMGLDIGIASVGWSVLNLDRKRIEDLGVRGFNAAEVAKDQSPLAEERRLARGTRRRLGRKADRLQGARDLFLQYGLIDEKERESTFEARRDKPSPWELRARGLDELLTGEEFARALFHIGKRRGFKSNRKKPRRTEEAKEEGKTLAGVKHTQEILEGRGYRTAGEMVWRDAEFCDRKRNAPADYKHTLSRATLQDEIKALFDAQRRLGSSCAAESEFERRFLEVFNWQRPFASGDQILSKVGKCTFEPEELRAPKRCYTVERFDLLGKVNSLRYGVNGDSLSLDDDQRRTLMELAYSQSEVTYAQLRKRLGLAEGARFTALTYRKRGKDGSEAEDVKGVEKSTLFALKGYHEIRKHCKESGVWDAVKDMPEWMDAIAEALTFYKANEEIRACLAGKGVPEEVSGAVVACEGFSGFSNLSLKAIGRILPFMEEGLLYNQACEKAGYDHSSPRTVNDLDRLPVVPAEEVRNPVVLRALSQARKVVNAIIRRHGAPYRIHIELAREVGKSRDKRKDIEGRQGENQRERERLEEQFHETFRTERTPSGTELLKWRLYREQNGQCAYSGKAIDPDRLFEDGYTEIDHVIPYSRSFNDSRSNRVLALTSENRDKLNKTPFEWFGHDEGRWAAFEGWVQTTVKDFRKRQKLLKKSFDEDEENQWKDRQLNDTQYIARYFSRFLRENLKFANEDRKQTVVCLNGQVVAEVRRLWGLRKEREKDDLHHALDATAVAALLPHNVQLLTEWAKVKEIGGKYVHTETGEVTEGRRPQLPRPWKGFREELEARLSDNPAKETAALGLESYADKQDLSPVIVSRMPQRKATGQIHKETIRSVKGLQADGKSAVRTPLAGLTQADLDNLFAPETNEKLYQAIRARMAEHNYEAKKAFAEPLYKPLKDGAPGPVVRCVKVTKTQTTGVEVRGGIADNGKMVRTDVFRKGGKHYLVPVYVKDIVVLGVLPDKAIAAGKPESEWTVMDHSYEFVFSFYPFDVIRLTTPRGKEVFGYYRECNRDSGSLVISSFNSWQVKSNMGARTALLIQKYEMGVLGDYYPVRKEVRRGVENRRHLESGEAET